MNDQDKAKNKVVSEPAISDQKAADLEASETDDNQQEKLSPASEKGIQKRERAASRLVRGFALTAVPAFIALIAILVILDIRLVFEPSLLLPVLNTVFISIMAFLVAYLSARGYLKTGSLNLLLVGTGVLAFGSANQVAGWLLGAPGGIDAFLTVGSTGLLFGSVFHLAGAASTLTAVTPEKVSNRRRPKVMFAYFGVLIFTAVLTVAVLAGALPRFFIQGIGATLFGQEVLGVAVALLAISSLLFMRSFFRSKSGFLYWYSLALALIAVGSLAVFLQQAVGSIIGWAGRSAQYLGSIYFLVGALSAIRGVPAKGVPLKRNYESYHEFPENVNVAIYTVDKDGVMTYVSPAIELLSGYSPSEVTGHSFSEFIYQDDLQRSTDNFKRILLGYTERNEYRVWTKSREIRWVSTFTRPLFSENRVVGAQGVLMDVTELKKREEMLVQEGELLQSLIDTVPDLIYFKDDKNRFIRVNKTKAEFSGTTPESMIGKTEFDFLPREQAEAASAHESWIMKFNKPVVDKLEKVTHTDGTERWVSVTEVPRHNEKGQVIGTMGISRDFTERKKTEEELKDSLERSKTSFEFAPDGIYLTDLQGTFIDGNEAAAELLGYRKEELIGKNFLKLQLLLPDGVRKVTANLAKSAEGKPTGPDEFILTRKDSTQVAVEISTHPVKIKGESSVLAIVRDTSERKEREEAHIRLERLKALREMAGRLAHDFNNLLAVILGNAQVLEMGVESYKSEEIKDRLGIIVRTAHDAGDTVRRMQLFTRTELSTRDFAKIDLNEIVRSAVASTSSRWRDETKEKGVTIKMKGQLAELPPLFGSRSELMEVLTNLIFNALEAMPEGGEITIRTEAKENQIMLHFTDTGEGIPESTKDRIFDPFFTTKGPRASGLGLSVSYGIIKRHQGKIKVESAEGKGTTVVISIPVRRQGPLDEEEARNTDEETRTSGV